MPEPVRAGQRYLPGLDGLRALAVLAVVAYHLNASWAPGGLLGVGVFFTLSGYLITDLLLGQREAAGRLQLVDFWQRRARRLLPALFVMLLVVIGWVALLDRAQLSALRGMVWSAALYVSNWWLIVQHTSYFARFGPPSSLGHLWSLAVEEQFYLIWPWLLFLGLMLTRRRRREAPSSGEHFGLAGVTLLLAGASALAMALLYHPGYDPTRVYDGTDTRVFGLLIGAALAFLWPSRKLRADIGAASRWCLEGVGVVGLLVIGALIWRSTEYSAFLYPGGMVLLSFATVLVVATVASPATRLGQVLGVAPVRWIGVRSYGIYLWHYPIIVLTTPATGQETLLREVLQVAASIAVAALSWRLVEEPIRHGALGRLAARARAARQHPMARLQGWAALAGGVGVLGLAGACLAGVIPAMAPGQQSSSAAAALPNAGGNADRVQALAPSGGKGSTKQAAGGPGARKQPRTSCQQVVHIGDSTSDGLISSDYLPNPAQRLSARYARVGVRKVYWEISGGRSIVETLEGQPNAYTVAQRLLRNGYQGCWVLALGTNDTADVAVGSVVPIGARISRMMSVLGSQPVLWINVKSLLSSGPYSETDMKEWDSALLRACARYPNMRVYDWADVVKTRWFINDGIHFTSPGYAARSRDIARALAEAFPAAPASQPSSPSSAGQQNDATGSCVVH
ncbi:MAG TPA: acyltransferase family protein [Streptosporangiaceae bacterium]|nr:acyltransferase family protein [Streptosporangiaceae bacterium]